MRREKEEERTLGKGLVLLILGGLQVEIVVANLIVEAQEVHQGKIVAEGKVRLGQGSQRWEGWGGMGGMGGHGRNGRE